MKQDEDTGVLSGAQTRRDIMKKAGVGAAVAWTLPTLLSLTPAAASGAPGSCASSSGSIVNGDCATGDYTGWNSTSGMNTTLQYGTSIVIPPYPPGNTSASFFFVNGSMNQDVAVGTACSAGPHSVLFSFYWDCYNTFSSTLTFFDVGNNQIGQDSLILGPGYVASHGGQSQMALASRSVAIPSGTTNVNVAFTDLSGSGIGSTALDLISLTFI